MNPNNDASQVQSLQDDVRRLTQENYALQERIIHVHIETFESFAVLDRVMRQNYKLYHDLRNHETVSLADRETVVKIEEMLCKAGVRKAPVVEMVRSLLQDHQQPSRRPCSLEPKRVRKRRGPEGDVEGKKQEHETQAQLAADWYDKWESVQYNSTLSKIRCTKPKTHKM